MSNLINLNSELLNVSSFDEIVMSEEGIAAIVEVSMENFITYSYEKMIYAENMMEELLDWQVSSALSHLIFFTIISECLIEITLGVCIFIFQECCNCPLS